MDERDWLVERFEEHRPHLRAVAHRMLGGAPRVVFSFTIADGKIVQIDLLADPAGLGQLHLEILDD